MKFVIHHSRSQALKQQVDPFSYLPRFLFLFFLPKSYWQTSVTDEGFTTSRPFGRDVHVPWSQVNLVDPSGLTELSEEALKFFAENVSKRSAVHLKTRRGFNLRLNDRELVRSACWFAPGKVTFCAGDTIAIESIEVTDAEPLKERLVEICKEKGIEQDLLVFDWPE